MNERAQARAAAPIETSSSSERSVHVQGASLTVDFMLSVILICLDAFQDRQALVERPTRVAARCPRVQIVFRGANHGHRIDRGSSAHHTTAHLIERTAVTCARRRIDHDVGRFQHHAGDLRTVCNYRRYRCGVRACFQQQHMPGGVFAQPCRGNAPRRSTAYHDDVICLPFAHANPSGSRFKPAPLRLSHATS